MQSRKKEYQNWKQKGDFSYKPYEPTIPLVRELEYVNRDKTSALKSLKVLGYRNGDICVSIETRSPEILKHILIKNNYPKPEFYSKNTQHYYLNIQNRIFFKKLLNDLSTLDNRLTEISDDILQNTQKYLKNESYIIGWSKAGVFDYSIPPEGFSLVHSVYYTNCDTKSFCKKLSLLGYRDGEIMLGIDVKEKSSPAMKAYLKSLDSDSILPTHVLMTIENADELISTLKSLRNLDGTISDSCCRDLMKEYYKAQPTYALSNFWNKQREKSQEESFEVILQWINRITP